MPSISPRSLVAFSAMLTACTGDLTLPGADGPSAPPTGPEAPVPSLSIADDRYTTLEGADRTLAIPSPGVLGNDRVDGSASAQLEAALVTAPRHGQVELRPDGSLSYTPEAGWFGTDRFSYRASLQSGPSADADVAVEVEPLNDRPAFTAGPDQEAKRVKGHGDGEKGKAEDEQGRETVVEGWATDIRPGPANESDQSVAFLVTVVSGAECLSGTPSVSPSGTLRYSASDHEGIARVEVRLRDDGGTAHGGEDTSPPHTLLIVVQH